MNIVALLAAGKTPILYAANSTELSLKPDSLPTTLSTRLEPTVAGPEYVVPCVHVPAPFPVGVVPSVV
jgi:hypothetical protein